MKILLAIDGSMYSERVVAMLGAFQLPSQTDVTVVNVVPEHKFLGGITLQRFRSRTTKDSAHKAQEEAALNLLKGTLDSLTAVGMNVSTRIVWGGPAEQILKLAHDNKADLIMLGAKGLSNSSRFPLGGVANQVMKYADTNVLLVRENIKRLRRVLLATDGSEHSEETARFLLSLPLPRQSRVVLVTSLESHVAALVKMPSLDMETNQRIIKELQSAEENEARSLIEKTREQFTQKGYQTESMILQGQPADEIIMASKTINPDLIALGAKGLNSIDTFLMGSVAHRVARFSAYSVLIGRQ